MPKTPHSRGKNDQVKDRPVHVFQTETKRERREKINNL